MWYLISFNCGSHNETTAAWTCTRGVAKGDSRNPAGRIIERDTAW